MCDFNKINVEQILSWAQETTYSQRFLKNVPYIFRRDLQFLASTSSEATGHGNKILCAHKQYLRRLDSTSKNKSGFY